MESLGMNWGQKSRNSLYLKLERDSNRSVTQYALEGYDSACCAFNVARIIVISVTAVFAFLTIGALATGTLVPVGLMVLPVGLISIMVRAFASDLFMDMLLSEEDQLDLVNNLIQKIDAEIREVLQEEDPARYQQLNRARTYLLQVSQQLQEIIKGKNSQDTNIQTFNNGDLINFWPPRAPPLLNNNFPPPDNGEPPSYESIYPQQGTYNPPVNQYNRNNNC